MYSRVKVLETLKRVESDDPKILSDMAEIILSAKEKIKETKFMSDIAKVVLSGRLTKDAEIVPYGSEGKTLTKFSIASSTGTKDKPITIFNNCTCFGKYGETIAKFFNKGDQIFIVGVPTQKKDGDKYYYGVTVESWAFGQKKGGANATGEEQPAPDEDIDNPFSDEDIPF